jgi:ABC-2 type transport system ATP-binding protein
MKRPVIECQALEKRFGRDVALNDLNVEISAGQVVGLIGTNGSGKSTLIKCLLGLLRRTSGQSSVFQEDSWNLSASAKSRLGYVSQDFVILPWMSVKGMCTYTSAFYQNWDHPFVDSLLSEWELPQKKRVSALSVGQRQKLAVILAMGHRPELLILDEPVASLDPIARRQFLHSLVEYTADQNHTILFSSHITSDLERIASHVLLLSGGRLQFFGELDQL